MRPGPTVSDGTLNRALVEWLDGKTRRPRVALLLALRAVVFGSLTVFLLDTSCKRSKIGFLHSKPPLVASPMVEERH